MASMGAGRREGKRGCGFWATASTEAQGILASLESQHVFLPGAPFVLSIVRLEAGEFLITSERSI